MRPHIYLQIYAKCQPIIQSEAFPPCIYAHLCPLGMNHDSVFLQLSILNKHMLFSSLNYQTSTQPIKVTVLTSASVAKLPATDTCSAGNRVPVSCQTGNGKSDASPLIHWCNKYNFLSYSSYIRELLKHACLVLNKELRFNTTHLYDSIKNAHWATVTVVRWLECSIVVWDDRVILLTPFWLLPWIRHEKLCWFVHLGVNVCQRVVTNLTHWGSKCAFPNLKE